MQQNLKRQRFNRIVIALAILVFLTGGIFSAIKFLTPASEPVEAAETYYVAGSDSARYTGTSSAYSGSCYAYLYVYCDNLGVSSISANVESDGVEYSDGRVWNVYFDLTISLKGYSWSSSATSFSARYTYGQGSSNSTLRTDLKSTLDNNGGSSFTYTRSGNTFTSSIEGLFGNRCVSQFKDSTRYFVVVIKLEKSTDSVRANTYTLTFDYNGGSGNIFTKSVTYNSRIDTLPTANRDNYIFQGWYISGTQITETKTWTWASSQTAVARWEFDGYTLTPSIDGEVGGSIIGADAGEYPKNSSVTVTASPAEGYVFDHWVLNGTSATANPLTFTITQNSTLVAYFREIPNVTVTISGDIECDIQKTVGDDAFIVIKPPTGYYVSSITLDNMTFPIQFYHANVYGAGEAHLVSYTVRDTTNSFSIYFENLFGSSTLEVLLVNVKPTYQNPPLGGASIEGVATQATVGGETRVTGFDTTLENATVHLSAVSYSGYVFAGWTASDGTDLSAYGSSADIPYSLIEGKIITANFKPSANSNANSTTDNQGSSEFI